ncbi:MAG TPA: hypothetical protein VD962_08320 [Rubricoccaceae bacterium]|nr:hypothetical protein [Rubricoccaceae bacterium]
MTDCYEVFDDEEVLSQTRLRAYQALLRGAAATGALVAVAALLAMRGALSPPAVVLSGLLVAAVCVLVLREVTALRRVVWCVKLSVRRAVGYDYGRRRTALPWATLARVEVTREGLLLVGPDEGGRARAIHVSHRFPEYALLSHRVVEYAEAFNRPVYVDGQPWQLLDVHALYPFLREHTAA